MFAIFLIQIKRLKQSVDYPNQKPISLLGDFFIIIRWYVIRKKRLKFYNLKKLNLVKYYQKLEDKIIKFTKL